MIIKNDSPFVRIDNILAGQTPKALDVFTVFLLKHNFDLVVEIGSGRGGFSIFISNNVKTFISYDISSERNEASKKNPDIDFRISDCLSENTISEIEKEVIKHKKVLILCDGGSKEVELATYGKLIERGSYIMCHDYAFNTDTYKQNQLDTSWPSEPESYFNNVKNMIQEIDIIKSTEHDDFSKVFWGCFIKQ